MVSFGELAVKDILEFVYKLQLSMEFACKLRWSLLWAHSNHMYVNLHTVLNIDYVVGYIWTLTSTCTCIMYHVHVHVWCMCHVISMPEVLVQTMYNVCAHGRHLSIP